MKPPAGKRVQGRIGKRLFSLQRARQNMQECYIPDGDTSLFQQTDYSDQAIQNPLSCQFKIHSLLISASVRYFFFSIFLR